MHTQNNKSLYESLLDDSVRKSHIEAGVAFPSQQNVEMAFPSMNFSKSRNYLRDPEDISLIHKKSTKDNSFNFGKMRSKIHKGSQNIDRSRKGKDISILVDRSRSKAKDISIALDRSKNKARDVSLMDSSHMFSFDNELKLQMENIKYNNLNEIIEDERYYERPTDAYFETLVDKAIEVPIFDLTNKFINLFLHNICLRRFFYCCSVVVILIRILLMVFFHYKFSQDPALNFVYLILIYAPRILYILTMIKILFQASTKDFFLERICQGFNIFDGEGQNKMNMAIQYDNKLEVNTLSEQNVTKFYQDRNRRFFQTLSNSARPILNRFLMIISPIEINYLTLLYLFRNLEESRRLVKKLMLVSSWIYEGYELFFLTPCVVLMGLNADIRDRALSLDLTFDSCVFMILGVEVVAIFLLILYLILTRNENVIKGPEKFL